MLIDKNPSVPMTEAESRWWSVLAFEVVYAEKSDLPILVRCAHALAAGDHEKARGLLKRLGLNGFRRSRVLLDGDDTGQRALELLLQHKYLASASERKQIEVALRKAGLTFSSEYELFPLVSSKSLPKR